MTNALESPLADVLLEDGRAAEAERALTDAIEAGLASGHVHYQLGLLYQRQALLPQAAQQFDHAGRFGPIVGRDHFYQAIGSLRVNQADFDGAIAAYSQRVDANPNGAEAHRQLGEIYFLQGRHDEALLELTTAAWLAPADARAHAAVGQVYVRTLKYAESVAAFERALALDDGLREARYGLATSLMRLGKADEAKREMATFDRLQAEAASFGQREFQLDAIRRDASRSLIAGAHERAISLFTEALQNDPGTARSHEDLGIALLRMRVRPRPSNISRRRSGWSRQKTSWPIWPTRTPLSETRKRARGIACSARSSSSGGNSRESGRSRSNHGERFAKRVRGFTGSAGSGT